MRIGKIRKALDGHLIRIATDRGGFGWLGDARGLYLVDDDLDVTEKNALAILDVPADKRNDYDVIDISGGLMPMACDVCPIESADSPLKLLARVICAGEETAVLATEDGRTVMVPFSRLKPFDGERDLLLVLRECVDPDTGAAEPPVVAAMVDMLASAIVYPLPRSSADAVMEQLANAADPRREYVLPPDVEEEGPAQISMFPGRREAQ